MPGYGDGALIVCDRLVRIYSADGIEVQALQGLDLVISPGELTALVGASGSGKSTLMNILAGLDAPTAGVVRVAGHDLGWMSARQRKLYRRAVVGFIWQQTSRNLLPYLTGLQNVQFPLQLAGASRSARRSRALELLDVLGVAHCAGRRPDQMSGGEQQRVAIGVALANSPSLLLADEPTGELDTETAASVFGALQTANSELAVTVLVVTHDPEVAGMVRRVIAIRDGRTSTETLRSDSADGSGLGHAVEYAVLDRLGRLQLPPEMTDALGMRDRVRLEAEPDHIGVWPAPVSARGGRLVKNMIDVRDLTRTYGSGPTATAALRGVTFTVGEGQLVALLGRSGSGKTTLLNVVGGLDTADGGSISVAGHDMTAMGERERMQLRRETVAYIFQSFGLLAVLSAAENVGVPLRIARVAPKERESRVELLLSKVGLADHAKQRPAELSGGQQQRVAIARALAAQPSLLLADEPTGQLDRETGRQIMRLLRTIVESEGVTALVATHDPALIDLADSVLHLVDGKITT